MKPALTIEIPADSADLVRGLLALHEERTPLALSAPDGTVFDACEAAVVAKGRDFNARLRADAVARRVATAEKKGRRGAAAPAAEPARTAAPRRGSLSVPSASPP